MDISLLFPLLILLLFVPIFLSARKQKRQVASMQELQRSLAEGDVVMTTSGLRGTVVDSSFEDTIDLEIAEGVVTTWMRAAVREKIDVPAEETPAVATPDVVDEEVSTKDASPAEPASLEKTSLEKKSDPANN